MKHKFFVSVVVAMVIAFVAVLPVAAKEHKITQLGSSKTSFHRPALRSAEDARKMLSSKRDDVQSVLQRSGWTGNIDDLIRAAEGGQFRETSIAPGAQIPFMGLRKKGKPDLVWDIVWAGKKAFDVFTLDFASNDRIYRLYIPKPCSNFWIEDIGAVEKPKLPVTVTLSVVPPDVCVTQSSDVTVQVENSPSASVNVMVNGTQVASGNAAGGVFRAQLPGYANPGSYTVVAAAGEASGTGTLNVKACPPVCSIAVNPAEILRSKPFSVNASGSKVDPNVKAGIRSVKVEITREGQVTESFELTGSALSRNDVVIRKPGTYTLRAVSTDDVGQSSSNTCEANIVVKPAILFVDGLFGKERLVREEEFGGGRCAALAGVKFGFTPRIGDQVEFEAAIGGKINFEDGDNSSIFVDAAINGLFSSGFIGGGVSFWDLTIDDTRTAALLVHGGFNLSQDDRFQFVVEGRLPFEDFDDAGNNYQFWGGIRFRFSP